MRTGRACFEGARVSVYFEYRNADAACRDLYYAFTEDLAAERTSCQKACAEYNQRFGKVSRREEVKLLTRSVTLADVSSQVTDNAEQHRKHRRRDNAGAIRRRAI